MSNVRRCLLTFGAILLLAIFVLVILIAVALGNALLIKEPNIEINVTTMDSTLVEEHLDLFSTIFAESIKFKTISTNIGDYDRDELLRFHEFLFSSFPMTFNTSFIKTEKVNNYSLLLTVQGSDVSVKPYMLTGHMDVVPVAADQWMEDPFLGEIITDPISGEKVIWGRGSIDDKVAVIGILAALEILLMTNWVPKRTFYIGFGHDEEVNGLDGAAHIAMLMYKRDVELDFLLDEGLPITTEIMPGVNDPVAVIGVTEKGSMSIRIEAEGTGGHSSIPPMDQAICSLSTAIHNLHRNPQPSMFGRGTEEETLKYIAHKSDWPYKFVFANTWLFRPLLPYGFSMTRESNALIRTTTAVTMIRGGVKENVIPATAWALINHRVHPSQDTDHVLQHDINSVGDPKIKFVVENVKQPQPISPYGPTSVHYTLLASVLKSVYPDVVTAPGFSSTGVSSGHYSKLTSRIYKFLPVVLNSQDIESYHGRNESLSLTNFSRAITFFATLIHASEQAQMK